MLPSVVEFCVFGYLGGLVLVHHASLFLPPTSLCLAQGWDVLCALLRVRSSVVVSCFGSVICCAVVRTWCFGFNPLLTTNAGLGGGKGADCGSFVIGTTPSVVQHKCYPNLRTMYVLSSSLCLA